MTWENPPRCFGGDQPHWEEYQRTMGSAKGPCVNCTPEFRQRMAAELKCDRPEVIFVVSSGEVVGVSADDQRYARILMGPDRIRVVGRTVEHTDTWAALLEYIAPRAHSTVARAITVWMRRHKKQKRNAN